MPEFTLLEISGGLLHFRMHRSPFGSQALYLIRCLSRCRELYRSFDHRREKILEKRTMKHVSVQELFRQAAHEHPHQVAIVRGDRRLSYRELEQKSNHLANLLL